MKKIIISALSLLLGTSLFAQSKTTNKESYYGNNLITLAPISIIDRGIGFGFSYERMLDAEQKIAFVLPIDLIFTDGEGNNQMIDDKIKSYAYFNPGLIFYPAGLRKFNYGIGPNIVLAYGSGSRWTQDQWGGQRSLDYNNFRMGLMINNYLLVNVNHSFSLQLNAGMGIRYINNYSYDNGTSDNRGVGIMGQFKFTIGYRF